MSNGSSLIFNPQMFNNNVLSNSNNAHLNNLMLSTSTTMSNAPKNLNSALSNNHNAHSNNKMINSVTKLNFSNSSIHHRHQMPNQMSTALSSAHSNNKMINSANNGPRVPLMSLLSFILAQIIMAPKAL